MKHFLLSITAMCCYLLFSLCNSSSFAPNSELNPGSVIMSEPAWIILGSVPDSTTGSNWFTVKNISTGKMRGVAGVIELSGSLYLPIHSSYPSFNKKVVEGIFIPDTNYYLKLNGTIFRVTKELRDTTIATVGQ